MGVEIKPSGLVLYLSTYTRRADLDLLGEVTITTKTVLLILINFH